MHKLIAALSILIVAIFLYPKITSANIGVGIGPGKIELEKPVKPGGLYTMPPFTVINTGDEAGDYEISVEYQDKQSQLSPAKDWFVFSPAKIHLDPGQSQRVDININIPLKAKPGDYFAFLSAHPAFKSHTPGSANMEISAAAKIYFKILPANIFQALYYRSVFLLSKYAPGSYVGLTIILGSVIFVILKRFISFNIGIERKKRSVFEKVAKEDLSQETERINEILNSTLYEVEKYVVHLSEEKFDAIFLEARRHKQEIINFFYYNNASVLPRVSPELKQILALSQKGLEQIKFKGKDTYEKILKMVIAGIVE